MFSALIEILIDPAKNLAQGFRAQS